VLFAAFVFTNVSASVFHVVMTRLLSPAHYGELGALLAAFTVVAVPAGAVQAVVARRVAAIRAARDDARLGAFVSWTVRRFGLLLGIVVVLAVAASPFIARFLHFGSPVTAALLSLLVVFGFAGPIPRGALQGLKRFRWISGVLTCTAILRFTVGVVLVRLGWGVNGAALGYVAGAALDLALNALPIRKLASSARPQRTETRLWRDIRLALLALGGYALVTSINLILVRHYFPSRASGFYAAAWTLGRTVLFLPLAIQMVAFPEFVESATRGAAARRTLAWSTSLTGCTGLVAWGILAARGPLLMRFLFGPAYSAGATVATVLTLAMALQAMTSVMLYYHLASGSLAVAGVFPAMTLQAGGIVLLHGSILQVAWVVLASAAALFAFEVAFALRSHPVGPTEPSVSESAPRRHT
jgi:O-antigen/teichoic acid export membrane protein